MSKENETNRHFEAENRYAHVCLLYYGLPGSPDKQPVAESPWPQGLSTLPTPWTAFSSADRNFS